MKHRSLFVPFIVLGLLLVTGAGAEETKLLVLRDGSTIPVENAEIQGSFVHVYLTGGGMQAYPIEDVDLEGSGLKPGKTAFSGEELEIKQKKPVLQAASMLDAQSRDDTDSVMTITDADVDHITVEELAVEEALAAAEASGVVNLPVSNIRKQISGGVLKLTGTIENNGTEKVGSISVSVKAVAEDKSVVGTGKAVVKDELAPGTKIGFAVEFPVKGPATDVDVTARGLPASAAARSKEQKQEGQEDPEPERDEVPG
jgi:hypothetical protein